MCRLNLWDFRMDYNYYKWGGGGPNNFEND